MHWAGGCISQHALDRGMSAKVECLPRGVSVQGGVCLGVCPGRGVSKHTLGQTHPPMDRMTDRCKNITFLPLLLQTCLKSHNIVSFKYELRITICPLKDFTYFYQKAKGLVYLLRVATCHAWRHHSYFVLHGSLCSFAFQVPRWFGVARWTEPFFFKNSNIK